VSTLECRGRVASSLDAIRTKSNRRRRGGHQCHGVDLRESGTGKDIIARCIHRNSSRSERVFSAVNCAALSPTLIEGELFGHERDAFNGAVTNRDIEQVAEGKFREDLYYRLSAFPIELPPLRRRRSDIGRMVRYFGGSI